MPQNIYNEEYKVQVGIEDLIRNDGHIIYVSKENKKKYVLSKYNPTATAQKIIGDDLGNKETIWIILGYGLGYVLKELRKNIGKENRILIVEPTQEQIDLQLEKTKEEDKNTYYFTGKDFVHLNKIIMTLTGRKQINNLKLIHHEVYTDAFSEYYGDVVRVIKEAIIQNEVAHNTDEAYNIRFMNNVMQNKSYIMKSKDISQHHNKYTNKPAVIVSAGPSLDKNIEHIKDFKGIVITGGRTLEKVLENEVSPDFLVSIDPAPAAYEVLGKYKKNEIPLVTVAAGEPQILDNHEGVNYFVDHGGYNGMVKQFLGVELPHMTMGSSVATLCLSLAHYLGCEPIIFIGQDLAYTNFKTHADTWQSKQIKTDGSYQYVDGYYGGKVPTGSDLITFLRWIEGFITSNPDRTYINATEGGADILGTLKLDFKEVVAKYNGGNKNIDHTGMQLFSEDKSDATLKQSIGILGELNNVCRAGTKTCDKILDEYKVAPLRLHIIDKLTLDLNNIITKKVLQIQNKHSGIGVLIAHAQIKVGQFSRFKEKIDETSLEANQRGVCKQRQFYIEIMNSVQELLQVIQNKEI